MVTSTLRNWKKIGSAPSVWIGFRQWRALHPASCFDSNPADGKWKDANEENMKVNAVNVAHREMRTTLVPTSKLYASARHLERHKENCQALSNAALIPCRNQGVGWQT